jgi:hypothetical protein
LQQRQQVRTTKSTLTETCKEKAKEVTSNTKRSENSSQAGMKRKRRVSFITRERDEILIVHFISRQIESATAL